MMRDDELNWHSYGGYTERTDPSLSICSTDKDESKRIIMHETYCRVVPRTRTNKNKASSTNLYRITIPRTWTKYVLQRKTNQNALLRNKKTQRMRLHMMFLTILTSLTYLNAGKTTLTCHTKERTWPAKEMNTLLIKLAI